MKIKFDRNRLLGFNHHHGKGKAPHAKVGGKEMYSTDVASDAPLSLPAAKVGGKDFG